MNSKETKPGRDSNGRYTKGQSPNPKGRRKKEPDPEASVLDVIFRKTATLKTADGDTREMSLVEAVWHSTHQEALKGKAGAITTVTKWVIRREEWRAKNADKAAFRKRANTSTTRFYGDPSNAEDALLILGVVKRDKDYEEAVGKPGYKHLMLEPWAVQAALSRRRGAVPFSERDIFDIERCSRVPGDINWPKGARE